MKYVIPAYRIFPLGDQGLVIDFGNRIEETLNNAVISLFTHFSELRLPWISDLIPAYSSLTVFYDPLALNSIRPKNETLFISAAKTVQDLITSTPLTASPPGKIIRIGVCYEPEFATDMAFVCSRTGLTPAEVIDLHTSTVYRIYMTGFLPGFPYMGMTNEQLDMPRKNNPVPVPKSAVGLAGRQTGIYPFNSPGGWQIIGRAAIELFDADKHPPTALAPGDQVRFYSISKDELTNH